MTSSLRLSCTVFGLAFASVGLASPTDARASVRLDSGWQAATVPAGAPAPDEGWSPAPVPGFFRLNPRGGSHDVWYRRALPVPADWRGRRVFLDLRSARYAPELYVDGRLVARRTDGWSPMRVELTAVCPPGETHRLLVRCHDWGGTFPPGFVWGASQGDDAIRGKVLAPIGGYKDTMGLMYPAFLESRPAQKLNEDDLAIVTSVRKGKLDVGGKIDPPAPGRQVVAEVWDGGKRVRRMPTAVTDAEGGWHTSVDFLHARYWSPEDPHRYELRLTLRNGGPVLDRLSKKFGFRELWTQGPNFVLNGVPRHLLASAVWPLQEWLDPATVRARVKAAKAGGIDAFRCHIGPWQEEFAEAADEIGLMLIDEGAAYTDGSGYYGYKDPRFWANYRDHLAGMIRRDRNHPSVVMWSLGNEILFMGNEKYDADLPKKLGTLAPFARAIDPTRPVTFEADLDPGGQFDVIGLHYPHELPDQYAYPNAGDWLGSRTLTEAAGGMLGQKRSDFVWNRRKPLYIGEYLWTPQGDYSPGTVFFGDDAYLNKEDRNVEAKALAWIYQTVAYRRSGVSGLAPWTAFEFGMIPGAKPYWDAQRVYTRRQAAFLRNRGLRFYSGETAPLRFDVFNDAPKAARMELALLRGGQVVDRRAVRLAPAGYADVALRFAAPRVSVRTPVSLSYRLTADGREVDHGDLPATVRPATPFVATVYDPSGKWPGASKSFPSRISGALLVAPNAAGPGFDGESFRRFLQNGGRAVVLEQTTLAPLGLGVDLVEHPSTMTFPLDPDHPVLRGLAPGDLEFWRGDNYVSRYEIRRSGALGLRAIAVSGGSASLAQGPIAEMAVGRGHVVFLQCLAGEKRAVDPAAGQLIRNALSYASAVAPDRHGPVLAVGVSDPFLSGLRQTGLDVKRLDGPVEADDLSGVSGVVLQGGGPGVAEAAQAAARAGVPVYWHLPTPEAFRSARADLGEGGLEAVAETASPTVFARQAPLLRGVSREDLTFTTPPASWDRQTSPRAKEVQVGFVPEGGASGEAESYRAYQTHLDRGRMQDGAAFFDRYGTMSFDYEASEGGFRRLTVGLQGTPTGGEDPVVEILVDRSVQAWLPAPATWSDVSLPIYLSPGKHRIALYFQNGNEWGGPRTLSIRRVAVGRAFAYPAGVDVLAMPAAVLAWKSPGGAPVVVDGIAWENDPEDRRHGLRYVSALFGNLGFPFALSKEALR